MANETTICAQLTDAALDVKHEDAAYYADRTGEGKISFEQTIGATNEALTALGDIGTVGWAYFENRDTTKTISLATQDDTVYFAKLLGGEKCVIPLATATLYAKASSASAVLAVTILER